MHTWNLLNSLKQLVGKEFEKPSCDKKEQVLESGRARCERGAYQLHAHEIIALLL